MWEMSCRPKEVTKKHLLFSRTASGIPIPTMSSSCSKSNQLPAQSPDGTSEVILKSSPKSTVHTQVPNAAAKSSVKSTAASDSTSNDGHDFRPLFEMRRLCTHHLTDADHLILFSENHRAILRWGARKCCLLYATKLYQDCWTTEEKLRGPMSYHEAQQYREVVVMFRGPEPENGPSAS